MDRTFTVAIDLYQSFSPPMRSHTNGICLTRAIQLPFVPTSDIAITGKIVEAESSPVGFTLKDIMWDSGRNVFLANTYASTAGPVALIPFDLRNLIDAGWQFGTFQTRYGEPSRKKRKTLPSLAPPNWIDDEDAMEKWEELPRSRRPTEFNHLLKALVRSTVEAHADEDIAYAISKTGTVFCESTIQSAKSMNTFSPVMKRFEDAMYEFQKMPTDKQYAWQDRVVLRNPSLEQFVTGAW